MINRWHKMALIFSTAPVYLALCWFASFRLDNNVPAERLSAGVVFWHPMLLTFVLGTYFVAIMCCKGDAVGCSECKKLQDEVEKLREALTTEKSNDGVPEKRS